MYTYIPNQFSILQNLTTAYMYMYMLHVLSTYRHTVSYYNQFDNDSIYTHVRVHIQTHSKVIHI